MKNNRMRLQIRTAIASLRTFQQGIRQAATIDDGVMDDEEKAEIEEIDRLTEEYIEKIKAVADGGNILTDTPKQEKKFGFFRKK